MTESSKTTNRYHYFPGDEKRIGKVYECGQWKFLRNDSPSNTPLPWFVTHETLMLLNSPSNTFFQIFIFSSSSPTIFAFVNNHHWQQTNK